MMVPVRAAFVACGTVIALMQPGVTVGQVDSAAASDVPPAGFGTLKQDDVSIALRSGDLEIQIVPLDERVIRLLAPDTYRSLSRLKASRQTDLDAAATRYGLRTRNVFLVTFFGRQPATRFEPEILTISSQNRQFRPVAIVPLSPLWSGRRLEQRETTSALYLYEDGIRILDPITVAYADLIASGWEATLRLLDAERASVIARASRGTP